MKIAKVGIVGCGMISKTYFNASKIFRNIEVVGCCDAIQSRAEQAEEEYGVKAMSYDELLANKDIEIILNLTPPLAHTKVILDTLNAGKHSYSEKPFGVNSEEAAKVMELAKEKNLYVGCAPDTFLGAGQQTARKAIDDGWIGDVLSGTAIVQGRGPEKWGQAPFFYDEGAGPMLDLGPYYITSLVNLLGPAKSVTAFTTKGSEFRTFAGEVSEQYQDKYKPYDNYPVNVNTHQTGIIEFQSGAVITVIASFDVYKHQHNPIEIYGTAGSLVVPDPNTFGGDVKIFRRNYSDYQTLPYAFNYEENSRSIGMSDMVNAIENDRPCRASGELANHVLEIMLAFDKASELGAKVELKSSCQRPAALSANLEYGDVY